MNAFFRPFLVLPKNELEKTHYDYSMLRERTMQLKNREKQQDDGGDDDSTEAKAANILPIGKR